MMNGIFGEFGKIREKDPASKEAQDLVMKLQGFITEHFYTCTDEVLCGLGKMYAAGGDMYIRHNKYGIAGLILI